MRYRFVNRAYAQRFGLEPEQVVGRLMSDVVGPKSYELFRGYVESALSGHSSGRR